MTLPTAQFFKHHQEKLVFLALFLIHVCLFFPGFISPDANTMYAQVLSHSYDDAHSPLMAYLWHYLNFLYPGPHLMYLFHLMLLWAGIYLLAFKFCQTKLMRYLTLCLPLTPWIAIHSGWVWKDVIFTFGYGLLSVILTLKTIQDKKFTPLAICLFLICAFYFTGVKFQGKFILPILLFWFFQIQYNKNTLFALMLTLLTTSFFVWAIPTVNQAIATKSGNKHYWQYVKIYDLAGMSVKLNKNIVPKMLHARPNVEVKDIQNKYSFYWEPLIVEPDSPLTRPKNDEERSFLLNTWKKEVLKHPIAYMRHRASNWFDGLFLKSTCTKWLKEIFASHPFIVTYLCPIANITAYIFLAPFHLLFFLIGFRSLSNPEVKKEATCLLYMLTMAAALFAVLFVFSLAAVPRYIYFSTYLLVISTPLALRCYQANAAKLTLSEHKKVNKLHGFTIFCLSLRSSRL